MQSALFASAFPGSRRVVQRSKIPYFSAVCELGACTGEVATRVWVSNRFPKLIGRFCRRGVFKNRRAGGCGFLHFAKAEKEVLDPGSGAE